MVSVVGVFEKAGHPASRKGGENWGTLLSESNAYRSSNSIPLACFLTSRSKRDCPTSSGENETGRPPFRLLT